MELRSISLEKLHLVITEPDEVIDESESQVIHQKIIDDYMYRVFIFKSTDSAVIKTAYKTSKINKYGTHEN